MRGGSIRRWKSWWRCARRSGGCSGDLTAMMAINPSEVCMNEIETGIALRTENCTQGVALRGVRLTARVAGMSVRAVVEQTFVNREGEAIEAWYTFPLPEGAA